MSTRSGTSLCERFDTTFDTEASVAASSLVVVIVGFVGWALRVATIGFGVDLAGVWEVLLAQAVLVVPIFTGLGWLHRKTTGDLTPSNLAMVVVGVVFALDFFLVTVLVAGDLTIFGNPLATWIPYLLMAPSTWLGAEIAGRPYC